MTETEQQATVPERLAVGQRMMASASASDEDTLACSVPGIVEVEDRGVRTAAGAGEGSRMAHHTAMVPCSADHTATGRMES